MLKERMADVRVSMQLARLEAIRNTHYRIDEKHYEVKFSPGDLVLRWTGNTKRGLYGKLAYTNTGPFEVVGVHPRNPDVYELKHLEHPDKEPTRHHVRELAPYITKEAHERSRSKDALNVPISELAPKVGDYLMLPYGRNDFIVQVLGFDNGMIRFQYLNKKNRKTKPYEGMRLVWFKDTVTGNVFNPNSGDDRVEIYTDKLTNEQVAEGYGPYVDELSIDQFYQKSIDQRDIKKSKFGFTFNHTRRMIVKKHKPSHMK